MTMRNRKTVIVAFVVLACMLLAVGFAAYNDELDIAGSAEVSQTLANVTFDEKVYFSAVSQDPTMYTAEISASDPDTASYKVTGLADVRDTVSITFTVKNDNAFDAKCKLKALPTYDTDHFTITSNVGETEFIVPGNQGTYDIVLTFTLDELPQEFSEGGIMSTRYAITFNVTDVVAAG